jgi:hypothetical protein
MTTAALRWQRTAGRRIVVAHRRHPVARTSRWVVTLWLRRLSWGPIVAVHCQVAVVTQPYDRWRQRDHHRSCPALIVTHSGLGSGALPGLLCRPRPSQGCQRLTVPGPGVARTGGGRRCPR